MLSMSPRPLSPEKLQSLSRQALWALMLRTAAVQARLLDVPEPDLRPEVRELVRFLASAVLQMDQELRRREDETERGWQLEELDPAQVVEAA